MRPNGPRRQRIDEREAVPWPEQTGQQRDAEALAMHFGLGYLSREGFEKLARLLEAVRREACQVDEDAPVLEHGMPIS